MNGPLAVQYNFFGLAPEQLTFIVAQNAPAIFDAARAKRCGCRRTVVVRFNDAQEQVRPVNS